MKTKNDITVSPHVSAREATRVLQAELHACHFSTHASAREATLYAAVQAAAQDVSTHASAREATFPSLSSA